MHFAVGHRGNDTGPIPEQMHLSRMGRVRLVVEGALVGVAVGFVIALYRFSLAHAESLMRTATAFLQQHGPLMAVWFAVLVVLCLVVDRLLVFEPYTQGSGIPQVDAEVANQLDMPWYRVMPIKLVEGILCAFAGLSLGREGPSILLGGMAAKGISRMVGKGSAQRGHERLLVTCGAAAGMSAAFHAPLTGVLFAVEEIHKSFSPILIISVMTASTVSDFVSSHLLGVNPLIHLVVYSSAPHGLYPLILLMGVVCGILGFVHNKGMFFVQDRLFGRLALRTPFVRMIAPFLLAGVFAFVWPDLLCGGDAILERVMDVGSQSAFVLLALLFGKYVFTTLCFGSGAPGGTLFPLVAMGSLVGALYGMAASAFLGATTAYENGFIVLGIAGLFAAVIQAPVTAVVLVFELTGSLEALLATTVVSAVAYVVSTLLGNEAFYEHLYARLLGLAAKNGVGGEERDLLGNRVMRGHEIVHSYVVGVGSNVEGKLISEVPWPADALVVTIREAGVKLVPKGSTRLTALSEVSVIMDDTREAETDRALRELFEAH